MIKNKEKERYIFDLDGTLWRLDFSEEDKFFKSILSLYDYLKFNESKLDIIYKYENKFDRLDIKLFSEFFTKESGVHITEKIIQDWIDFNCNISTNLFEDTIELLEYLKSKNKSLAVRTNFFLKAQCSRMKNTKIFDYVDDIYAGDSYLKPNINSYIEAASNYPIDKCVMIGDNLEYDVLAPRRLGMDSIYYNPKISEDEVPIKETVKSLIKIKDIYN